MWSTCHEWWNKERSLSPRTPVGCSKHWAMRDWRTRDELGHIKGPCMTCILRTARVSNVEIIMSRGVLIKRVEFRENVRARDVKNCPQYQHVRIKQVSKLKTRTWTWTRTRTWKKIIPSQRFLKTKYSHVFFEMEPVKSKVQLCNRLRAVSFFFVLRAKRARHRNDHARDWRRPH